MAIRVARVDAVRGEGAYYNDDLLAIRAGAPKDGLVYGGDPVTPGLAAVRQPAQALLLRIETAAGAVGWGDAMSVQYAGVGGRDLPVDAAALSDQVEAAAALLKDAGETGFRAGSDLVDAHRLPDGRQLHTALRYGLSQALLAAEAAERGVTPLRVLAAETGLEAPVMAPVYAQSGDERRLNADRMILRRVDVLPHGLFNSAEAFGADGGAFLDYVRWLVARIAQVGGADYRPRLHLDVYGMLGLVTDRDVGRMAAFLAEVEAIAGGLPVAIESPCLGDDTATTIELLAALRARLAEQGTRVQLAADEFCNGDEDVAAFVAAGAVDQIQIKMPDLGCLTEALKAAAACRAGGLGVFIGGSCAETDLSAQLSAQLAMAVSADQVLAKPGMGVDEGIMIVRNAMRRALVEWDLGR